MASDKRASRLAAIGVVAMLLFGAMGMRMWFLQVVDSPALEQKVQSNKTRTQKLLPERGRIFDRFGRIMADNEKMLTVTLSWEALRDQADRLELFGRLAPILQTTVTDLETRYGGPLGADGKPKGTKYSPLLPLPIQEDVGEDTAMYLLERSEDFLESMSQPNGSAPIRSHQLRHTSLVTLAQSLKMTVLNILIRVTT